MSSLLKLILTCLFNFFAAIAWGQEISIIDSLKSKLSKPLDPDARFAIIEKIAARFVGINMDSADIYGERLVFLAESSRNREWMIRAYLANGARYAQLPGRSDFAAQSMDYYKKANALAKKNRLSMWTGISLLRMSTASLAILDKDAALNYANEAVAILEDAKNDSLLVESDKVLGNVHLLRNNKTTALRYYLSALNKAEEIKDHRLILSCYLELGQFYSNIEDYDRAIDYFIKAIAEVEKSKNPDLAKSLPSYYTELGSLFAAKKEEKIAGKYFERSISMADSLKDPNLKVSAYLSILNQYLSGKEPKRALDYFNSSEGAVLKSYLSSVGFAPIIDQAYAIIYTETGNLDSARWYYKKSAPFIESSVNESYKIGYKMGLANLFEKSGQLDSAINQYLSIKEIANRIGLLEASAEIAKQLDTLYFQKGDFRSSRIYTGIYHQLKDSLDKMNKEKELVQVEAANEQARVAKVQKQQEEAQRQWHHIQYMGITIIIGTFFVLLVLMGVFKVSVSTIRVLGFFGFIMFFEFLIMIADTWIHEFTHGEPWEVLLIKIIMIAMLLPLHHWLERKTIHYLTSHNRLTMAGRYIRKVFGKSKPHE